MKIKDLILEKNTQVAWNNNPKIGWWLDNNPVRFYHGTNIKNLEGILDEGIYAPSSGPTSGWVSLALEPNTAFGYASMSGGESSFRAAGAKAHHVPAKERVVLILEIPQNYFLSKMAPARGNMDTQRNKLKDRELYDAWARSGKTDQEYYQLTEIRLPDFVPSSFIVGYMKK